MSERVGPCSQCGRRTATRRWKIVQKLDDGSVVDTSLNLCAEHSSVLDGVLAECEPLRGIWQGVTDVADLVLTPTLSMLTGRKA